MERKKNIGRTRVAQVTSKTEVIWFAFDVHRGRCCAETEDRYVDRSVRCTSHVIGHTATQANSMRQCERNREMEMKVSVESFVIFLFANDLAFHFRIVNESYAEVEIGFNGKKTALVIVDDGLPVFSSQIFIWLTFSSLPSSSPFTVSFLVFMHHPVKLRASACCFVYFRKNTPCTLPNTSNSHMTRCIVPCCWGKNQHEKTKPVN